MGGGGGGDPGAAARQQEAERQARITAATDSINAIFNNQTKTQGTRYVSNPSNSIGIFNRAGEPQRLTAEEYAAQKAAYDKALAENMKNSGNFGMRSFAIGDDTNYSQVTADQITKEQLGFDPSAWSTETYETWAPGDPANSRDKLYADQKTAVYDLNKREVDRQATEAERMNRFGLARSGLLGGSVNVDSLGDIDRRTNEGLMRAGGIADQAAADLKTQDERTRSNLISLAQSGIDTGTAAQQALKGLEVNSANAASARAGSTVGSLFNDMSQAYLINQQNQGRQAGNQYGGQWYGVSSPSQTYQGSK